ncbi:pre-mRNA-splicing factor rse1 [Zygosaccharomyces mellis]|uniref:Pre-mRNA-splicing factor rse1 n=1 Tax=Zygosaccharomyces mellis TaxID=42258 RepID=A0A4C2E9P5_9SACH|nr:pre-mRNA-splicing factor rse1 [Zygosaccharomyces mellis]
MFGGNDELILFHLTLQRQTNYEHSCIGHFIDVNDDNNQETNTGKFNRKRHLQLCISTQTHLELYTVSEGSLRSLAVIPLFATITAMETLNLENSPYSFLALASDSGNLTISKFVSIGLQQKIVLQALINQPLTRSGLRRLSPISHLQTDLHGRCLFLSAIERNKLCFVANQVGQDGVCIQDPLEALVPNTLTLDIAVCDVRYDNPCFASLELQQGNHYLMFYILDLGLNHIVKRASYKIEETANFLMGLPDLSKYNISTYEDSNQHHQGDYDEINPFVVIGFENFVMIKDLRGFYDIKVPIPRRKDVSTPTTIICFAVQTLKNDFFVLLQSNYGDLFKLKVQPNKEGSNRPVASISYFDTVPQAKDLHIFKNGFLFINAEFYDNHLFQFESLGDDDPIEGTFEPSPTLRNLSLVDTQKNLNPLISSQVTSTTPLTLASNSKNTTRFAVNGVDFENHVSSNLTFDAKELWSVKFPNDTYHRLLFLASHDLTMILETEAGAMGELAKERHEFKTKFDKTIFVGAIGTKSVLQVCVNELRQLVFNTDSKNYEKKLEWFPPAGIRIVAADCTHSQLAVGLSNGEICYFEIDTDSLSDSLHELQNRVEIDEQIEGLAMIPELKSDYLAVGTKEANLKVLCLKKNDMENFLEVISIQALMAPVNDLKITRTERDVNLHIGLVNGLYSRSKLNRYDGQLYDVRNKFLGPKEVTLSVLPSISFSKKSSDEEEEEEEEGEESEDKAKAGIEQKENIEEAESGTKGPCIVLHSINTWVAYECDSFLYIRPILLQEPGNFVKMCQFSAENLKTNGCCAIDSVSSVTSLTIGGLENFVFREKWFQMRDHLRLPTGGIEENQEDSEEKILPRFYDGCEIITFDDDRKMNLFIENSYHGDQVRVSLSRSQKLFNSQTTNSHFEILENMRVITAAVTKFSSSTYYLVVSTTNSQLYTFELFIRRAHKEKSQNSIGEFHLKLLHKTPTEDRVYAIIGFRDKLLIPIFGSLILYGLGKKQLLKRSISSTTASITRISSLANWKNQRVAVGDNRESVTLLQFDSANNVFIPIADDVVKRHVTTLTFIDQSTVIGGDKFGNIWTLRLSREQESFIRSNFPHSLDKLQQNPDLKSKAPNIMECPFKLTLINHFYINDIPTAFHLAEAVQISDRQIIVYCGLQGTIGSLLPLLTNTEVNSLKNLESVMNDADDIFYFDQGNQSGSTGGDQPVDGEDEEKDITKPLDSSSNATDLLEGAYSIVGRDILKYRSYYVPVRNVIDGDLCETFLNLSFSEQTKLCKEMGETKPEGVYKQLNDIRTNYM